MDVLVVEDNPTDSILVAAMLEPIANGAIEVAESLTAAREALSRHAVRDLLVLDLLLPDAGGPEIVTIMRALAPDAAVLVLTGSQDDMGPPSLEAGAHQYLPKDALDSRTLARTVSAAQISRKAERDLETEISRREKAMSELDEMVGVVAHDLRAPIRTTRIYAERLSRDPGQSSIWMRRLDASLARMDTLALSLVDYARLSTLTPRLDRVDVAELGKNLSDELAGDLVETGGDLEWEAVGSLWADPLLCRQIIESLVHNGLQYRRLGQAPVVRVRSCDVGRRLAIDIVDNGIGIEEAYWEKVFRPFERLDIVDVDGVGLGLAAARRLAELMGGQLDIHSSAPGGSTFRLLLPSPTAPGSA